MTNVASRMAVNPDPKPGRWILPLVVLGMVAFTYFFVQQLPGAATDPEDLVTTTSAGEGSDTTQPTETTAPTTTVPLDPAVASYLDTLTALEEQLIGYQTEMSSVNSGFDANPRTVEYNEADDRLEELAANLQQFADTVSGIAPPVGFEGSHQALVQAANDAAVAAQAALEGLRLPPPDTGEQRRQAVAAFDDAVGAFQAEVANIRTLASAAAAPGTTLPTDTTTPDGEDA